MALSWNRLLFLALVGCSGGGGGSDTGATGDDDDTTVVGDDDDGVPLVTCTDPFDPCGGDPTGTWAVAAVCSVPIDTSALGCGEVTYELTDDRSSGSVDLNAGGTYTRTYQIDVDYVVHVPDTCLVGPITCGNLAALSSGAFDSCTDTGTGLCDCTGSLTETDDYTGTWSLDGNVIVTDDGDRTEFCVEGNQAQTVDQDGGRVHWSR